MEKTLIKVIDYILEVNEDFDYKKLSLDEICILKDYIFNLRKENFELRFKITQLRKEQQK